VRLVVYDILGREISILINESLKPNSYEISFDGTNLSAGVYFYALSAENYRDVRKMVLIK